MEPIRAEPFSKREPDRRLQEDHVMRSPIVSISLAAALAFARSAQAQSSAVQVAVNAGSATDERGVR